MMITAMVMMLMYKIFVAYYIVEEVELLIIAMMTVMMSKTRMRRVFINNIFVAYYNCRGGES